MNMRAEIHHNIQCVGRPRHPQGIPPLSSQTGLDYLSSSRTPTRAFRPNARITRTRAPISPRSTGCCATWDCISSSTSSGQRRSHGWMCGNLRPKARLHTLLPHPRPVLLGEAPMLVPVSGLWRSQPCCVRGSGARCAFSRGAWKQQRTTQRTDARAGQDRRCHKSCALLPWARCHRSQGQCAAGDRRPMASAPLLLWAISSAWRDRLRLKIFLPRRGHLVTEPASASSNKTQKTDARHPGSPVTNELEHRARCPRTGRGRGRSYRI